MGKNKKKALISNLEILLIHLLKYKFQPNKRTRSWLLTIEEHRRRINQALKNSPSLKNYLQEIFENTYQSARIESSKETKLPIDIFPIQCPFISFFFKYDRLRWGRDKADKVDKVDKVDGFWVRNLLILDSFNSITILEN